MPTCAMMLLRQWCAPSACCACKCTAARCPGTAATFVIVLANLDRTEASAVQVQWLHAFVVHSVSPQHFAVVYRAVGVPRRGHQCILSR